MNNWHISIRNIKSKPLYTILSVLTLSLSITLLLGTQQLKSSFEFQEENNLGDIDVVLGAKGSPLQLVLSSVLHLDNPTGNISYDKAKRIVKTSLIDKAIPISYGDNFKGFRIVGTTNEFAGIYNAELKEGHTPEKPMQVVLGDQVAKRLKLKIGDTFLSSHGLVENTIDIHDDEFRVVGVFKPTHTVFDRLIITSLESIWSVHNHETNMESHKKEENHAHHKEEKDEHGDEAHHEEHNLIESHEEHYEEKEITSLLISFKNPLALLNFPRKINKNTNMLAVLPKYELEKLFKYTGVGLQTISWIAYLVLFISGLTIFISFYKMIKERAFDLALLRTYGASNFQLILMLFYEGLTIVFLAFIMGFLLTKIGLYFLLSTIDIGYYHSIIQGLSFEEIIRIMGLVVTIMFLSIGLSVYPIIRMNISTILSREN